MPEPVRTWQRKDARANFSTLVDKAISDGPQIVTRNGKKAVVVVSMKECMRCELVTAISWISSRVHPCAKRVSRSIASGTIRARSSFDGLSSRHQCRLRIGAFAEIDRLLAGEAFPDVGPADDPPVVPNKRLFFDA
jgi:prevent-host-death family protein